MKTSIARAARLVSKLSTTRSDRPVHGHVFRQS